MVEKEWRDLSTGQKWGLALSAAVQIGLLTAALMDIHRPLADREGHHVVLLDLDGANYNVDLSEKVPGAVSSHGGAATAGNEL